MYKTSVLTDMAVACGQSGSAVAGGDANMAAVDTAAWRCYVKNDQPGLAFTGKVQIDKVLFSDGSVSSVVEMPLKMAKGPGVITWFDLPASAALDGTKELLHGQIFAAAAVGSGEHQSACDNIIALTTPGNMVLPQATVTLKTATVANEDGSIDVTVRSNNFSLYVTLTTLANGRFSENAFMLTRNDQLSSAAVGFQRVITFIPFNGSVDISLLATSIRVEHVAAYMFY